MLQIDHLTMRAIGSGRVFLDDFSYTVRGNERTVIIGEEGNGKSSLLKYMYDPSLVEGFMDCEGRRTVSREILGYLPQSINEEDKDIPVYAWFGAQDGFYDMDASSLGSLAAEMGLSADFWYQDRAFGTLSGGEQIKAELAALKMKKPTVYLLDEPSNNLDLDILAWLEKEIVRLPGAVLFVSHDVHLIDACATGVIHMEQLHRKNKPRITVADVDYETYRQQRYAAMENQREKAVSDQKKEKLRQQKLQRQYSAVDYALNHISRQDPHGAKLLKKKMKSVKSAEKRYAREKEDMATLPEEEESIAIELSGTVIAPGRRVLELKDYCLETADGRVLCAALNFSVYGPKKVAIIGSNGAGKSTLLRQLLVLLRQAGFRVGYMPQNYAEVLKPDMTPIDFLAPHGDRESVTVARSWLGSLRYTSEEMTHTVKELSGGQQGKLLFLKMALENEEVLVLDEPTRNFSPLSQPVIDAAIRNFPGVVISVSHDREYLSIVPDVIYQLDETGLVEYSGFIEEER
ncbi:ATP-binding cassette domain-containing protein [Galactobacillus timonensis]|uniref:ATP-binding cassette domain-containing protein n=1 Tax=Galactobacillus timonensis TaxID=2041840 RepID=UPI000C845E40|nr:ATP-binding cassette domain-containing protein [Galactobacillus timonensis]